MASDHQQQQQQQQQVPTQQQPTHLTQTQQQQQSHQLPQTNQSPLSQQQQQQLSQSQQSQSQQGSLQQQTQSHHRQQPAAPQHQTSAANSLPQQTELLSHSSTTLDSGRHSGGGGGSSNATGDPAPHNLSSSDPHQTQQQFCLRWNNFQSNIVNSFETLLDREELVDVTLTAEGRSLRAHRVLLSACSPYFRDLFQDVPPHQHPVIVLRDTRFLELKCLLCFIYHGEVNVSQDNLSCLLNLAENLKVKGLAQEGTKRHNSKEYEYGGRGVLSPDREGDLSDGGEPSNIPRPSRGGHLLRPGRSVSPAPPGVNVPFGNLSALGSLLGNPGLANSGEGVSRSQLDDHVRSRDIRDNHHNSGSSKGSSISLLNASQFSQHERKDQLHVLHQQHHHQHQQQQQQQHHSPPSKRRKRHPSPLQHHSPSNTTSSSHHHQQQQQQSERFTNNNSGSQLTPPSLPLSTSHNNGGGGGNNPTAHSNSSAHTPSAAADDDGNTHAVNLSVCPSTSPPRLMVPKLELITADDDTSNGEKERLERLEQRERICNFLGKDSIAGMMSKFPGGFTDSDMEGEEEPPPPHDEENSADMEGHGPGGGLSHPLSHHLPPGLQQSFVPYPPTTHAAAAAAAAAAHHFANTFTPGPSGVPSSVSPASWRSHASDQNPNSPQGSAARENNATTMNALETLVDSLGTSGTTVIPSSTTDPVENFKSSIKDKTLPNYSMEPRNNSAVRELLTQTADTETLSVSSSNTELLPNTVSQKINQMSTKDAADHHCNMLNTSENRPNFMPSNFTNGSAVRASFSPECSSQIHSESQTHLRDSTLRHDESVTLEPCLETPPPKLLADSEINLDHPMTLLKCELQLDEDSTNPDEEKLHVPEISWMEGLEKIDKEEIDVSSDLANEVVEGTFEEIEKSFNTLASDDSAYKKSIRCRKSFPNNSRGKFLADSIHSLGNTLDSFNSNSTEFDINCKKRRRNSAEPTCTKYTKASFFTRPSSLLAAATAVSQINSNSPNTNNFSNSAHGVFPTSLAHLDTRRPTLNKQKSLLSPIKNVGNLDGNIDDDNDEISIINDTMSSDDADPVLLLPDCSNFSLTSPTPSQDVFPGSLFTLSGSPQYSAQSSGPQLGGMFAGSSMGVPSPSRQSCCCPLCGRHIAQRRSLKQHLMSNFHKLSALGADLTIRRCLNPSRR